MKQNFYSIFMYVVMGGFTTLINIVTFWAFNDLLHLDYRIANTIAWVFSVLFAYVTNKRYVFKSNTPTFREMMVEFTSFVGFRFLSYLMDLGTMIVLVSGLAVNETISKILANFIVLVANYIFSKLFIFKKREGY
ncbi:GtrA family protein [Neobacillus mesonae]|uniref:GtrA family protein n=1 Tax=Neobacillus mesonae TaxID=1193713 RepID=UPI002E1B226F|nr:GtrA family protein [Neobacillus mesonae]